MKSISSAVACGLLAFSVMIGIGQTSASAQASPKTEAQSRTAAGDKAEKPKRPLTAQQQKLKDCGAKWQEEKKTKGVKGRDAWNKFRSACMKG